MTATLPAVDISAAHAHCEQVTREQARNFHYGIRLLPPDKRAALCAIYALARRVDDIADDEVMPAAVKLRRLSQVRELIRDDRADDAVLVALRDAHCIYPIPLGAFDELVTGAEMDVAGTTFATFEDLVVYCRCVAGSIGRLCLSVFGARDMDAANRYADALGIALQQTNILRDIREDLINGRVYLPQEDLDRHGVRLRLNTAGVLVDDDGRLTALIHESAARARDWYDEGLQLLALLDRRSAACCAAMSGIYRVLLDRIDDQPSLVFDCRLSLSGWQKTTVAARALAGRMP
jgi:15-cis-phytoene synthase